MAWAGLFLGALCGVLVFGASALVLNLPIWLCLLLHMITGTAVFALVLMAGLLWQARCETGRAEKRSAQSARA